MRIKLWCAVVMLCGCSVPMGLDAGTTGGGGAATGGGAGNTGGGSTTGGGSSTGGGSATGGGGASGGGAATMLSWFSDWRDATGATQGALYDGTKWTDQLCNAPVLEVVNAAGLGLPTANALRLSYLTESQCLMLEARDRWRIPAPGEYVFLRLYYRNDIPDGQTLGSPHPIHFGQTADPNFAYALWFNFAAPAAGASPLILQLSAGVWPDRYWSWSFATQRSYRLEVRIHRLTVSTATASLRVSDAMTGMLLAADDDWTNGETGANLRVLGSGRTFPVTDDSFRFLHLGNNGPAGLVSGTGRFVYLAGVAVAVSADESAWLGAYPVGAEVR